MKHMGFISLQFHQHDDHGGDHQIMRIMRPVRIKCSNRSTKFGVVANMEKWNFVVLTWGRIC